MNEVREQMLERIMAGTDPERVRLVSDLVQQGWPLWRVRDHLDWLDNAKSAPEGQPTPVSATAVAQPEEISLNHAASSQSSGEIIVMAASSSQSSGEVNAIVDSSQSSGEIKVMAGSSQSSGEIIAMAGPEHAILPD